MTKKNKFWIYQFIVMGFLFMLTPSCEKDSNPENTVTDIDGNVYHTITIGSQTWMVENLKTTKYNNGNAIPNITDNTAWGALATPGYCWFNNVAATNKVTYGALYNWYAVNSGKLCPTGWHVPTDAEWTILENNLIASGYNYDGTTTGDRSSNNKIAKSLAATINWVSSTSAGAVGNTDYPAKRNATGFTAIPGGCRFENGLFADTGYGSNWWSSSESSTPLAWYRVVDYSLSNVGRNTINKSMGFSVRCVRDN